MYKQMFGKLDAKKTGKVSASEVYNVLTKSGLAKINSPSVSLLSLFWWDKGCDDGKEGKTEFNLLVHIAEFPDTR